MPHSIGERAQRVDRTLDPLRNYNACYSLLDEYRLIRDQRKMLVTRDDCLAAQQILDINEDIKESYGVDTVYLLDERHGSDGVVAPALNQYRKNILLYGWALEPRVVEHVQRLVDEGFESDKIEERQRQELHICRSSFEATRDTMVSHLISYVASIREYNANSPGTGKNVSDCVLTAIIDILRWVHGQSEIVSTHEFLRSKNLRHWGFAGYTAKVVSIYYRALRKTKREVDSQALLAIEDVMELDAETAESFLQS